MATRIHIVLPDDVLAERDQLVGKRKRSQFIEEAVRDKLRMERQHKAIREGAGILKDYDIQNGKRLRRYPRGYASSAPWTRDPSGRLAFARVRTSDGPLAHGLRCATTT